MIENIILTGLLCAFLGGFGIWIGPNSAEDTPFPYVATVVILMLVGLIATILGLIAYIWQ